MMTRRCPLCSQTKIRPSGARAMAVGLVMPAVIRVSAKPVGKVAAASCDAASTPAAAAIVTHGCTGHEPKRRRVRPNNENTGIIRTYQAAVIAVDDDRFGS